MRFVLALALTAWLVVTSAHAQEPQFDRASTHDIAACRTAGDQPVCLLRALAHFPTHSPYRTDWRLAGADEVLTALNERPLEAERFSNIPYATTRFAYGYLEDTDAAVAAAIVADRRGAAPVDVLRQLGGPVTDIDQMGASYAANARCTRFSDIWQAYGGAVSRAARPSLPRPSVALTRAAIEACERENVPADVVHPSSLAHAYAEVGDYAGARRAMMRDARPAALVRIELANLIDDFDDGAIASGITLNTMEESYQPRLAAVRLEVLRALRDAGRNQQATELAAFLIDEALSQPNDRASVEEPMKVLIAVGDTSELRRFAETLEARAHDYQSVQSIGAAGAAVRAWMALGERGRALAIARSWQPRVEQEFANGGGCGGSRPFCASFSVMAMYASIGDLEEGYRIVHDGSPSFYLSSDIAEHGLRYLDIHLAHATTPREVDSVLSSCAMPRGPSERFMTIAETCARRLLARADVTDEADPAQRARRQYNIASAALGVGSMAASAGDYALAQEMLDAAMGIFATSTNWPLQPTQRAAVLEITIFQLEQAGRLGS